MVSQLTMHLLRKNHCCKITLCILHGVSPSSKGRDFCCLGDFHGVNSSLPVCLPCTFLFCHTNTGSLDDKCICKDICMLMDICDVSLLQHLWSSFTAEVCHRNWNLKQITRQLCYRLDVTLSVQRKAVYLFFFLRDFSCVLTMAFLVVTKTSSNTQK